MKSGITTLLSENVRGVVLRDEPMACHTTLRVGGPADFFVSPVDLDDLRKLLSILAERHVPYLVIGSGSNLLVRDGGFRGAVISLGGFRRLELVENDLVHADAGLANWSLVGFTREKGLTGLEFLIGIPGSVGGSLAMNAGAGGQSISGALECLFTLRRGAVTVSSKENLTYGYRFLHLEQGEIILGATFRLLQAKTAEIEKRIGAFLEHRSDSQQVGFPNAGSFFKNPASCPAWRLIDEAGLRGCRIGGAQVSDLHANFLVNRGGATATDFISLAALIKKQVRDRTGIELEEEVRIIGEDQ